MKGNVIPVRSQQVLHAKWNLCVKLFDHLPELIHIFYVFLPSMKANIILSLQERPHRLLAVEGTAIGWLKQRLEVKVPQLS